MVLLSSAISNSLLRMPVESAELEVKHEKIGKFLSLLLETPSMGNEAKIISVLLGKNITSLLENNDDNEVILRKLRGMVFTDSIVMKCVCEKENESHMYKLTGSWQVIIIILDEINSLTIFV